MQVPYQAVDFSIEVKYAENQIKFSTFIGISYSTTTTFEIASFLKFVEDMPQEDFKRKIEFSFYK